MKSGLKKKILLVSSGFKVCPEDLKKTIDYWALKGFDLVYEPHLMESETQDLLCSAPLKLRFREFKKAFESRGSDFVWSLRGGYGAQQLLPLLEKVSFSEPKTYLGFSDGTSIHYYLNMHLHWPSLHAPHPNTFHLKKHADSIVRTLVGVFMREEKESKFENLELLNKVQNKKVIEADVVGGNLTTLVSLLGTPYDRGADGKILFLEEIEEPAYKVMRHLHHMEQSGFLKGLKALVFGHMTHSNSSQEKLIYQCLKEWCLNQASFPVVWGLSCGHRHFENRPLWFLKKSALYLDEKPYMINNIQSG